VRRLILRVHLATALIAGAFILVLGVTGSTLAFEPELDRRLHAHLSYVKPSGRVLSLGEIGDAVSRQFNAEPIVAYLPSRSADFSWKVILPRGIVCVNQYTGEILGVRTRGQTILGFAHELHVRLASGDVGRNILRWSGVATLISLASGLYLWWPTKRFRICGCWRSREFWFDLHNSLGVLLWLPLLALAATGTVIAFEDQAADLLGKLTRPVQVRSRQSITRREPAPGAQIITPDEALAIAGAQMPGAIPYRVQMPRYGGAYRVSLDDPGDRVTGGHNLIVIDEYSGGVISSTRSSDLSAAQRILATNEAIHRGDVFGMPTRIVAWLTCVMVPVQVISGLLLWLRGRNSRVAVGKGAL